MNKAPVRKLLFACSRNRMRSLTAEKLFDGFPLYQVRSVGTQPDARIVVTEGHPLTPCGWPCMPYKSDLASNKKTPGPLSEAGCFELVGGVLPPA
jgi:hypothetical protein